MRRRWAAATLVLLAAPVPAGAWGPTGHRVVGRIAEHHLSREAARAVDALIGPETLAQVSTWADFIRADPAWKRSHPWHYFDVREGQTIEEALEDPVGELLPALERLAGVLRDPGAGRQERVEALKFLVHLVGDVHQPLHLGRPEDRGGNDIEVLWFGEPTNLHSVWDSRMIDSQRLTFSELAEFIDHPRLAEVRAWQASGFREWARESLAHRERAYEVGDGDLGWIYLFRNWPLVERRLLQAGIRLAGLLDSILASPSPSPSAGGGIHP